MMVARKQKIGVKIKGEYIMKIVLILSAILDITIRRIGAYKGVNIKYSAIKWSKYKI